MSKTVQISRIMSSRNTNLDVEVAAKAVFPMIQSMLTMFGKQDQAADLARDVAETLQPIVNEITREQYEIHYTEDELKALADFYEANPWYYEKNTLVSERVNAATQERSRVVMEKVFDKYFPDSEEEPEKDVC